jgi:hypothetical protein
MRSSLLPGFGYLRPWIASTSPVSALTQHVQYVNDLAYLGRYITVDGAPQPVSAPSTFPPEEYFSYLARLIEVEHAPILPPLSRTSSSFSPSESSSPSLSPTQSELSSTFPTVSSSPATPAGSPVIITSAFVTTTPGASPPLPPKPPQYLDLQHQDVPPINPHELDSSESFGAAQESAHQYC